MKKIDVTEIRALYGDSDYVTISVFGLEMLLQEYERLRFNDEKCTCAGKRSALFKESYDGS